MFKVLFMKYYYRLASSLIESIVLKMYFDGAWENLTDGSIDYENEKVTTFCFPKNTIFEQC